jgi:PAS domain S-box-containing protein
MKMANPSHLTQFGLPGVDSIPFGMHSCHFYDHSDELVAALVPYFLAGLRANERCLWITAPPLPAREAVRALRAAWNGVDDAVRTGALQVLDFEQWRAGANGFDGLGAVESWLEGEERALAEGYSGLRIAGNRGLLMPGDWSTVLEYERAVTERFSGRRIVALCSYALGQCDERQVSQVLHAHHCVFKRSDADWQVVTEAQLLADRADGTLAEPQADLRTLLDTAAAGLCLIDRTGAIRMCNASFLRLTGFQRSEEVLGRDFHQLTRLAPEDGSPCLGPDCPVLKAARAGVDAHASDEMLHRADGTSLPVEYWVRPIAREGRIEGAVCTFVDITERKQAEAQQDLLNHELAHRVKNTLAVVQAIVSQTLRSSHEPKDAVEAVNARLLALGRAHDLLMRKRWDSAPFIEVIKSGIAAPGPKHPRIQVDGPRFHVGPGTALALTMALHELCTNAIKYGALSNDTGMVALDWNLRESGAAGTKLHLRWKERGGPPVAAPAHTGFGSRIIDEYCRSQLGGDASLSFDPDGVEWTLDVPLSATRK